MNQLITHLTPETTSQQLFDYVATFLVKQGALSTRVGGCAYRGASGLMCAAGCIIPDEFYDRAMEGLGITEIIDARSRHAEPLQFWAALAKHRVLLSGLQEVHDTHFLRDSDQTTVRKVWVEKLRKLAKTKGLVFDESLASIGQAESKGQ